MPERMVDQSRTVRAWAKQLRERERRITLLRSQLDVLKVIDREKVERYAHNGTVSVPDPCEG
jgi:hypothetical protein